MSGQYIRGTNHLATINAALDDFFRALTRRWREVVCQALVDYRTDFPAVIHRERHPYADTLAWVHDSTAARVHLAGGCRYVQWVHGGQSGSLSAVSCDGATGLPEPTSVFDHVTGESVTVPPHIECGMGRLLEQVEDWAWGERGSVLRHLPLFDHQDLEVLERVHDAFIEIGGRLRLEAAGGSDPELRDGFQAVDERVLPTIVNKLNSEDGEGQYWWSEWTGLAADSVKSGFFASVLPTLLNQSGFVGVLANLYAYRAAIIELGRNNALYWLQWATASLDETELVSTDVVPWWKGAQGVGSAVALGGFAWAPAGVVGGIVALAGFVGENLLPGWETEEYKSDLAEVVRELHARIDLLNLMIDKRERTYHELVFGLKETVQSIHSFNLELYDFTGNTSHEAGGQVVEGYQVNLDEVLRIGEQCYQAGEEYAHLLPIVAATGEGDRHLADRDGRPTSADVALLELRGQFEEFLKTTCARYLIAGDQVRAAADAYSVADDAQRAVFDDMMAGWENRGTGKYDVDFDPHEYAQATERGDYALVEDEFAGEEAGRRPPSGAGYVIESGESGGSGEGGW